MCMDNCSSCQPINEQYSLEHVDNVLLLFNWLKLHLRYSIIYPLHFGYVLVTFWLRFGCILATFWLHFGYNQNVTNLCRTSPTVPQILFEILMTLQLQRKYLIHFCIKPLLHLNRIGKT